MTVAYLIDGSKRILNISLEKLQEQLQRYPNAKFITFDDIIIFIDKIICLAKYGG